MSVLRSKFFDYGGLAVGGYATVASGVMDGVMGSLSFVLLYFVACVAINPV